MANERDKCMAYDESIEVIARRTCLSRFCVCIVECGRTRVALCD